MSGDLTLFLAEDSPPPLVVTSLKSATIYFRYGERDERVPDALPYANEHEQEDGTILAVCATGTSSKDSLLSWVRLLQMENPDLENIPILFSLTTPQSNVVPLSEEELNAAGPLAKQ